MQAKQLAELFLKPGWPVTRAMSRAQRAGGAADSSGDAGYASSNNGSGFGVCHASTTTGLPW